MTKLDIGYVHCTDAVEISKVTFRGLPSCQGSEASYDSGRSTASTDSNRLSAGSDQFPSDRQSILDNSATSDELYNSINEEKNRANLNLATSIPDEDLTNCDECNQLKVQGKIEENTETCYLQGHRCQKHSDLHKTTAIIHHNAKDGAPASLSTYVSSPTRSPLSNYNKDRKRSPSGGSVIKQIQHVLEKEEEEVKEACKSCDCPWRVTLVMFTLLLANLLNYMDRYTVAGVLIKVQDYYDISNAEAGLLQTSFIVFYMLFSPIFGYLGDRWNRKYLMAGGIAFWSAITLAGSFIPADRFWLFLLMRAMVGIGEASYSTIAPTIIADLFVKDKRSKALSVFYFAIPVGSGMGYIVGSKVAKAMNHWQWALRVTPGLGILCVLLIMIVVKEPPRGQAEGGTHLHSTSWGADLKYLVRNKSFMLSTAAFTCVAFVAGALALWAPAYIEYSIIVQGHNEDGQASQVSLYFGIITCAAGFLGVGIGSEAARRLRRKYPSADPAVCAFGLITSAPFLFLVIFVAKYNTTATWVLIFIVETLLCLNWAIVTDILLYTVIPTRRSSAEAVQILISHALGDAGSPYLIGAVSDALHVSENTSMQKFLSLQYAMYMACFVVVLGGGFFLATALFVQEDRAKADKVIKRAVDSERSSKEASLAASAENALTNGDAAPLTDSTTPNAIAV